MGQAAEVIVEELVLALVGLVDGACGDIKCFSDLYAPRANRQIRVCFCDRRSHRKRIGSRIVFLKRLVEDERQGGISTGKLS